MMKEPKAVYALLLDARYIKECNDYRTFKVDIVHIKDGEKVRNPDSDDAFADLCFTCQWDARKPTDSVYGWDVTYHDVFSVDEQRALRMAGVFNKIRKA